MRKYEARFFPSHIDRAVYVVVGHLVWDDRQTGTSIRIVASPTLKAANAPAALLATLRYLVLKNGSKSAERLASTETPFWSFVEIEPG